MQDHYKTLGVNSSATMDEIRRAYRILARRYHPDLNPGKGSEERFKAIAAAYGVLGDPLKREGYDLEYDRVQISSLAEKMKGYQAEQYAGRRGAEGFKPRTPPGAAGRQTHTAKIKRPAPQPAGGILGPLGSSYARYKKKLAALLRKEPVRESAKSVAAGRTARKVSIIEVSLGIRDAILGIKKTVEIPEPEGARKVSVAIPPGVRPGSVVRLAQEGASGSDQEEIVLIVRVANHPFVSIQSRGLVIEVPISISEALFGASITLPTLDEPAVVKIPAGSQSGTEIRIKGKGVKLRDGSAGDIIYRLMVKIPESANAVGIKEKLDEFERYYETAPRKNFPQSILDFS